MEFLTDGNFKREIKISLSKHRFTTSEIWKLYVLTAYMYIYIQPVSVSIYYVNIYFFWSHLKIWLRLNCREDSALLWPRNKVECLAALKGPQVSQFWKIVVKFVWLEIIGSSLFLKSSCCIFSEVRWWYSFSSQHGSAVLLMWGQDTSPIHWSENWNGITN